MREIELLQAWIKAERKSHQPYKHWSYEKPLRPQPPQVNNAAWPKNDVDRFLLARLGAGKTQPLRLKQTVTGAIRRLSLDLTGLPPTLAEVDAFVNDKDQQAYENWRIACWISRLTVNTGPANGSIWPATPIRLAMPTIRPARSGCFAIMSSVRTAIRN